MHGDQICQVRFCHYGSFRKEILRKLGGYTPTFNIYVGIFLPCLNPLPIEFVARSHGTGFVPWGRRRRSSHGTVVVPWAVRQTKYPRQERRCRGYAKSTVSG